MEIIINITTCLGNVFLSGVMVDLYMKNHTDKFACIYLSLGILNAICANYFYRESLNTRND